MEGLVTQLLGLLGQVPSPVVYLIAAVWVGLESAGIGVPIEPMMVFVGSLAAQGHVVFVLSVLTLGVGCLAFASLAYLIGKHTGTGAITHVGRFIGLTPARADHVELWLRRRGAAGVFIARLTPLVRTFGSFIMGAADIPYRIFAPATLAGALVYCGVWTGAGYVLGARYKTVFGTLDRYKLFGVVVLLAIVSVVALAHHFWGRMTLIAIARYFHLHHGKHQVTVPPDELAF